MVTLTPTNTCLCLKAHYSTSSNIAMQISQFRGFLTHTGNNDHPNFARVFITRLHNSKICQRHSIYIYWKKNATQTDVSANTKCVRQIQTEIPPCSWKVLGLAQNRGQTDFSDYLRPWITGKPIKWYQFRPLLFYVAQFHTTRTGDYCRYVRHIRFVRKETSWKNLVTEYLCTTFK